MPELLFTDSTGCCIDRRTGRVVAVFVPYEEASREEREETAKRREYASQEATQVLRRAA